MNVGNFQSESYCKNVENSMYQLFQEKLYIQAALNTELDHIYECLKTYNYFILSNQNFRDELVIYLQELQLSTDHITQFNIIQIIQQIKKVTDENYQRINEALEKMHLSDKLVKQSIKLNKIDIDTLKLRFNFDFEKLSIFEGKISKFYQDNKFQTQYQIFFLPEWNLIPIFNIVQISNYLVEQIQNFGQNNNELILSLFQIPLQNEGDINGIFILGKTRVGKSTIAQFISNPDLIKVGKASDQKLNNLQEDSYTGEEDDDDDDYLYLNVQDQNEIVFKINHEMFSSENRQIVSEKLNEKYMIFDCPGFDDTQKIYQLINAYNIYQQLKVCKKIILLILIDGESQHNFYKYFKETIKQLNSFGEQFLCQTNTKPIFIITKIKYQDISCKKSYLYKIFQDKEKFLRRDDNEDYIEEFKVFFSAFETGRVIYFPHPLANNNLQLKQIQTNLVQIIEKVNLEQQNNYKFEFQQISEIYNHENLKAYIEQKIEFFFKFYFSNLLQQILNAPLEEKIKDVEYIFEALQKFQDSSYFELYQRIEAYMSSKIQSNNINQHNAQFMFSHIFSHNIVYDKSKIQIKSKDTISNQISITKEKLEYILSLSKEIPTSFQDLFTQKSEQFPIYKKILLLLSAATQINREIAAKYHKKYPK